MQLIIMSQNFSTSTPLGIATPRPSVVALAIVRPSWPVNEASSPCLPSVTTVTEKRSPPLSSNLSALSGLAFAKIGFRFDKRTATARGSCSGGPVLRPKTVSYVAAKKVRRACSIRRRTVGVEDPSVVPVKMRDCTVREARTWCVRSRLMRVVLGARIGLEKIDWEASGSHCSHTS